MNNQRLSQNLVLTILLVFIGTFMALKLLAGSYSYPMNTQASSYNRPSYATQYNYRYNYGYGPLSYSQNNPLRMSGAANYVGGYGSVGWNPFLMPSSPDTQGRTTYNSHMYIRNKLDYVYYTNPQLLQPRRMDNHQRYVRGLWPERGGYYY